MQKNYVTANEEYIERIQENKNSEFCFFDRKKIPLKRLFDFTALFLQCVANLFAPAPGTLKSPRETPDSLGEGRLRVYHNRIYTSKATRRTNVLSIFF